MFQLKTAIDLAPGLGFRFLLWGEAMAPGDEVLIDGAWEPSCTCRAGLVWHNGNPAHPVSGVPNGYLPFRRRLDGRPAAFVPVNPEIAEA